MINWTVEKLIAFEEDIKQDFLAAKIKYPVHFSAGNESELIEIFKEYDIARPENWVFSTHRSHLHALLKGIPPEWVKEQIYRGNSMHLISPEYKFFASSIVGGCCPIAVGVADGIKRQGIDGKVFVFVGDMASQAGIFDECQRYAKNFDLPILFIIEDNGLSTNTPTYECWGGRKFYGYSHLDYGKRIGRWNYPNVRWYEYQRLCPHINTIEFVEFR